MKEARCNGCGKLVLWARSARTKKYMPLDPVPTAKGSVEVKKGRYSDQYWFRVLTPEDQGDRHLYESHFATCPKASRFRKRA